MVGYLILTKKPYFDDWTEVMAFEEEEIKRLNKHD